MSNIKCTTCGYNDLDSIDDELICQRCGSGFGKEVKYDEKLNKVVNKNE